MPISVLIVGTDGDFRRHLKTRLLSEGFQIKEAGNESDFEDLLSLLEMDVVLLDLTVIGQKGVSFIDRIKILQPLAQVIALIPQNGLKLSLAAMQHRAYDDLMVPFSWKDLLKKIKAAAKQKKLEQKGKKGFWRTLEDHMTAIGFAEEGASDFARDIIRSEKCTEDPLDKQGSEDKNESLPSKSDCKKKRSGKNEEHQG